MSFQSKKPSRASSAARSAVAGAALVLAALVSSHAQAAGIEDTVGGGIGLGRAAYFARVNDFMAVLQNPANLAVVPGGDLSIELRVPLLNACFDKAYDPRLAMQYKTDEAGNLIESFDRVCNDFQISPTTNLGWARSYKNGVGWGIGLFTPAASGNSKYGSDTIRTIGMLEGEMYERTDTGIESPTRQMGIERRGVIAHLMLGIGYQVHRMFRVGASAGWGFASVYNKSVVSVLGGTFKDQEVINELNVKDMAIPRATASMVFSPWDRLDLFGVFQYQGDIDAKGYSDLTANGMKGAPRRNCSKLRPEDPDPGTHCRIDGARLNVPLPTFEATVGLRYAHRRVKREQVLNPMRDEVFDIEVDASWSQTSHVDEFKVNLHDIPTPMPGQQPFYPSTPRIQFANAPGATASFIRQETTIPKQWKDTWTIRAGADWNVIPEKFTLRLGGSFMTRAVPTEYMNIDYFPVQKIGAHAGATFALSTYRITLAYSHMFMEQVEVPLGQGGIKDIATIMEAAATGVNEGTFWASLDIVSLQLSASF